MFFVVFYDTWCSTVPESWLNTKVQTLRWPPKNENATTAAKKDVKPKKDWKTIKYSRLLGPYETFDVARTVEIAAVDLSTSDDAAMSNLQDGNHQLTQKRTRKRPARYRLSSETGSSGNEDMRDDTETNPKDVFHYDSTNHGNNNNSNETQELDDGDFFDDSPSLVTSKPTTKKQVVEKAESYVPQCPVQKVFPEVPSTQETIETPPDKNLKCSQNCCAACRSKLDTLIRLVNTLVMNQENTNAASETFKPPDTPNLLPDFPLTNILKLDELNELLKKNESARTQYIRIITLRRDKDAKKHTRDILAFILTDEFARRLSWTGQKKTIKVKDMEFAKILIETITQNNNETSNGMIVSAIQSWLQHSGDRIGYREKKIQK